MSDGDENPPLSDEEMRRSADAAMEALARAREEYKDVPLPKTSPGKFTEPVGLDGDGNPQPPLTPEEEQHNEEVRRQGREEDEDAG